MDIFAADVSGEYSDLFNVEDLEVVGNHSQSTDERENVTWPLLSKSCQGEVQVQQCVFDTHSVYKEHLDSSNGNTEITRPLVVNGHEIPVLKRPPGYSSEYVHALEEEARGLYPPTFNMASAVFIIDPHRGQELTKAHGHCVSFGGPAGRMLHPVPMTASGALEVDSDDHGHKFVSRIGGDKIPETSTVKPWRFEVVFTKDDPTGKWYVCLYVPYAKRVVTKRPRVTGMSGDTMDSPSASITRPSPSNGTNSSNSSCDQVDAKISVLVDTLFQKVKSDGCLTKGEEQEKQFRKSVTKSLQAVIAPFHNEQKMNIKWPDYVFADNYVRLSFAQEIQHFETRKHLSHLRPAKEVEATGVHLILDHINLVESVENLHLHLRDHIKKSDDEMMHLQQRLEHVSNATLDTQIPSDIEAAISPCILPSSSTGLVPVNHTNRLQHAAEGVELLMQRMHADLNRLSPHEEAENETWAPGQSDDFEQTLPHYVFDGDFILPTLKSVLACGTQGHLPRLVSTAQVNSERECLPQHVEMLCLWLNGEIVLFKHSRASQSRCKFVFVHVRNELRFRFDFSSTRYRDEHLELQPPESGGAHLERIHTTRQTLPSQRHEVSIQKNFTPSNFTLGPHHTTPALMTPNMCNSMCSLRQVCTILFLVILKLIVALTVACAWAYAWSWCVQKLQSGSTEAIPFLMKHEWPAYITATIQKFSTADPTIVGRFAGIDAFLNFLCIPLATSFLQNNARSLRRWLGSRGDSDHSEEGGEEGDVEEEVPLLSV